jgi:hypothetical protein
MYQTLNNYLSGARPVDPISIRWIFDVAAKMVKTVDRGQFPQVSGLRRAVVSARIQHVLSEMNAGFRLAPRTIAARGGDAPRPAGEGGQEVGGRHPRCAVCRPTVADVSEVFAH